jgi:hypothetical protein
VQGDTLAEALSAELGVDLPDLAGGVVVQAQPGTELAVDIEDAVVDDVVGERAVPLVSSLLSRSLQSLLVSSLALSLMRSSS